MTSLLAVARRAADRLADLAAPRVVLDGRAYRIGRRIRGVGSERLHRATAPDGRPVVLKWARPGEASLLATEHRMLGELRHPHLVQVVDYGIEPRRGIPVLAVEHVDGDRLGEAVQRAREHEVGRWFVQSLRVCAYLASRGVVHCDLKPDNILVDACGQARVIDFGVARRVGEPLVGLSLAFVAPEHLFADDAAAPETDLYAVGVSFYWLLTGQHPYFDFDGPLHTQRARLKRAPVAPTVLNPTISPGWDACLLDLVAVEPERRAAAARRVLAGPAPVPCAP